MSQDLPNIQCLLGYLQKLPDTSNALDEARRVEHGIETLTEENKTLKERVVQQKQAIDKMSDTHAEHLCKKDADIKALKKELDETRLRLSKLMALRMTDNNPNIADLSDPNRPTKLAEQYGELYDNEWTDAFETLTKTGMDEKTAINTLRDVITKTYEYCKQESENSVEKFKEAFTMIPKEHKEKQPVELPEVAWKEFKEYRKEKANIIVEIALETFLIGRRKDDTELAKQSLIVEKFLTSCFRLCWMMSIQDPPIYLDQDTCNGDQINKDKYRYYTATGFKIDYIVWPCILIEKDGAVLYKGVAQCIPERTSSSPRLNTQKSKEEILTERRQNPKRRSPLSDNYGGNDPTAPEVNQTIDQSEKAKEKASATLKDQQPMETDEIDGRQTSKTQGRTETGSKPGSKYQQNSPDNKVESPTACTTGQPCVDPPSEREIRLFVNKMSFYGSDETRKKMGEARFKKCEIHCRNKGIHYEVKGETC